MPAEFPPPSAAAAPAPGLRSPPSPRPGRIWPPPGLLRLSLREWRHHPWRHGMALLAVALGVALAWSVHLINTSALAEFAGAVRAA
ncbi:MAG: hypothetical protein J0L57_19275, partial [Burkholderiales bacterium]|nr:hypothetical protein [Burkholderiales bacterium]